MFTRLLSCAAVTGMLVAPAAFADPKPRVYHPRGNDGYDYAQVVSVQPIVRQVRVETPRRECWTEVRYDQPQPQRGLAGPMIVGGLIGGGIGHQFGGGDGKRAATLAGALIGTALAHDYAERQRSQYASSQPQGYEVERCDTRIEQTYEERIDGYDVEYEYCGRRYHTRLPYDPGERMRIRVDVSPAQNSYGRYDSRYDDDRDYGDGDYDD